MTVKVRAATKATHSWFLATYRGQPVQRRRTGTALEGCQENNTQVLGLADGWGSRGGWGRAGSGVARRGVRGLVSHGGDFWCARRRLLVRTAESFGVPEPFCQITIRNFRDAKTLR